MEGPKKTERPESPLHENIEEIAWKLNQHHGHRHEVGHVPDKTIISPEIRERYLSVIKFSDIHESIVRADTSIQKQIAEEDEVSPEIEKNLKMLKGRGKEIEGAAHRYYSTLIQFYNVGRMRDRMESEELKDRMTSVDHARRRAHNVLIDALVSYGLLLSLFKKEGYLKDCTIVAWDFGNKPPNLAQDTSIVATFSSHILSNREKIKDWAIGADLAKILEESGIEE